MRDPKTGEWLEPTEGTDMSTSEGRHFKKEPAINIISKDEFEVRVEKVFHLLWQTLAKSFGPYGAPTLICNYPYRHITKDGYTIMKNLSFDASETKVDQAIADMAGDICGRLNYSVGDGTTSAIIATNSIYQNYRANKRLLDDRYILPRDVMKKYEKIKERVIEKLQSKVKQIRTDDMDELYRNIYDVVYISSNGDETITGYIADLYKELGAPGISCIKAPDGITKKKLINGYKFNLTINDRLYINNDDNTAALEDADVIIFGTKITENTYRKILKPLNLECASRGRHLIVAAPSYDEMALVQVIAPELNTEYHKTHDVNMVLTTYRAISAHTRKLVNDFSVLMNTTIIDRAKEKDIIEQLGAGKHICQVFNIDSRNITGTKCIAFNEQTAVTYVEGVDKLPEGYANLNDEILPLDDNAIRLGFVKSCALGLKESQFTDLLYDEERYKVILKEAEDILEETEQKYQKLGTFNLEVSQCQERLYALKLKMGIIEVGADSDMSQALLKDAVDDSVRAAESAYKHGVVLGCNTNLIQCIREVVMESEDEVDSILGNILLLGFTDVYKTVLNNAFPNILFNISFDPNVKVDDYIETVKEYIDKHMGPMEEVFSNQEALTEIIEFSIDRTMDPRKIAFSLHDVIILYSIMTNQVFDVSTFRYSTEVINSSQTDEEILTAAIDLISLLIVGNQMVVTQKHNFQD